ncbi:YdcF family protein [Falsiroseomonas oryzae]|uniref:YdcF family protein n=1 Tax=Falsiroseomonas oryzae TaxID=2766473 RepID=UPI0022EA38BF|nr:YdcF family protein [Roseomonas sp. MO-31]
MQNILTILLLPPLLFVWIALGAGLLAWRGSRAAGAVAALAAFGLALLSTTYVAAVLSVGITFVAPRPPADAPPPVAIVVLGAEMARGPDGPEVGPLTLERLRAGAALHKRTGLPLLLTGGPLMPGAPPIAELMAATLERDFGIAPRWVENRARDTRDNAELSAAMLRADGIGAAYVVSQAWHLPRAQGAFARARFPAFPAPVRTARMPDGDWSDWLPHPANLGQSWFALREWAGLLVYRLRDGT